MGKVEDRKRSSWIDHQSAVGGGDRYHMVLMWDPMGQKMSP